MNRLNWVIVILITILSSACSPPVKQLGTEQYLQTVVRQPLPPLKITRQYQFKENEADLDAVSRSDLMGYAAYLRQNPNTLVRIEGHADSHENATQITSISAARAKNIAAFLVEQGVSRSQIDLKVFGNRMSQQRPEDARFNRSNSRAVISFEMRQDPGIQNT